MSAVTPLPTAHRLTVRVAADAIRDTLPNPNTVRAYAAGIGKTALRLGKHRPLAAGRRGFHTQEVVVARPTIVS